MGSVRTASPRWAAAGPWRREPEGSGAPSPNPDQRVLRNFFDVTHFTAVGSQVLVHGVATAVGSQVLVHGVAAGFVFLLGLRSQSVVHVFSSWLAISLDFSGLATRHLARSGSR